MGFGFCLKSPERRRPDFSERRDDFLEKYSADNVRKERKIPASRLSSALPAFSEFRKTTGILHRVETDIRVMCIESANWGNASQYPKRQAGNPPSCSSTKVGMSYHG